VVSIKTNLNQLVLTTYHLLLTTKFMQVKIYQPTKTATQSGTKVAPWILEPVFEANHKSVNNIMGWTSSDNSLAQIKLKFNSSQDAAQYAKGKGWSYQIIEPKEAKIIKKSYADNFLQ
jgi:hypothetical protein